MSEGGWLLDTNVVSELARPQPNPRVLSFIATLDRVVVASIVVFELERGIALLPSGRRKKHLAGWLETLLSEQIVVADLGVAAARNAARLEARAQQLGRPIDTRDALILGTAASASLGVATRNLAHLAGHGVRTTDPFG